MRVFIKGCKIIGNTHYARNKFTDLGENTFIFKTDFFQKVNHSKLHTSKYKGYTLDIGFRKYINENISIGGTIQNIGKEDMGSSYVTIDPRFGFGASTRFKLGNWGTTLLNEDDNIYKTKGNYSLFLFTDILYEDDKTIYKIATKTQFPYINFMFGTSYSEGYRDFSYGMSFDFNNWSFILIDSA